MAILFIAAEADELKPFAQHLTGLRPLRWPLNYAQEGILDGRRMLLAAHGAGPKLAAQALEVGIRAITAAELQSSALEAVVSVGYGGALDEALHVGEIVVASEVRGEAADSVFTAGCVETARAFQTGTVFSQDRVAQAPSEKREIRERYGAIAVEMEALAVAQRAKRAEAPFYCIKVISDRADEQFRIDFNAARTAEGRISRGKIVRTALTKPANLLELFRLRRRALEVAGTLGDFLVSCRFNLQSAGGVGAAGESASSG